MTLGGQNRADAGCFIAVVAGGPRLGDLRAVMPAEPAVVLES